VAAFFGMRMECQVSLPLDQVDFLPATGSPSAVTTFTWVSIAADQRSTRSALSKPPHDDPSGPNDSLVRLIGPGVAAESPLTVTVAQVWLTNIAA